ncbi:MAG: TIGR04053 family radical SAM/SPASM domain-containing protein [Candidatus Nanopelagicales bacterium]
MAARALRRSHLDLTQRPFIVIWEATRACQLACRHCRAHAVPDRDPAELDGAAARRLMDQVLAFGSPPPFFVITGGDPFERPDLFELVAYGAEIGLPVAVSPSGTEALDRRNLTRLREAGCHAISLSLDGSDPATHDDFRGVCGSHRRTMAGWRTARDLGLKVQINTTVTPANLQQLPDIVNTVDRLGAMTWSVFFLVPTGRGADLAQLTSQQAEDVLHFCYDADKIVSLKTTEAPSFRRVCIQRVLCEREGLDPVAELGLGTDYQMLSRRLTLLSPRRQRDHMRRPPLRVSAARGFVFVSHTGDVYPSGFLPVSAGNVGDDSLAAIYRDSELFRSLRDPDAPHSRCGSCEFRAVCGGSRPRAFGDSHDVFADDPLCSYEPGSFGREDDVAELVAAGV